MVKGGGGVPGPQCVAEHYHTAHSIHERLGTCTARYPDVPPCSLVIVRRCCRPRLGSEGVQCRARDGGGGGLTGARDEKKKKKNRDHSPETSTGDVSGA